MTAHTLMLTPWYTAHKVIPWQTAVTMLFLGKVEVVDEYDEILRATSLTMKMPAVVRLKNNVGAIKRGVKYSHVNVLARDGFRCQYCSKKGTVDTLNRDHVIPRSQGGKTTWENTVASCYECNTRKRDRTPDQAGMPLLSRPHKPKTLPMTPPVIRAVHPIWQNWIGGGGGATVTQ
jgi:5-methylcytosine-specific restriction endonuclease McrA